QVRKPPDFLRDSGCVIPGPGGKCRIVRQQVREARDGCQWSTHIVGCLSDPSIKLFHIFARSIAYRVFAIKTAYFALSREKLHNSASPAAPSDMKFLNDIRLLLLGLWLGASVFFIAVAQVAFMVLPQRESAGAVVGGSLSILNF